jgi:hypothetical protein
MTKRAYYRLACSLIRDGHTDIIYSVLATSNNAPAGMRPIHFTLLRLALRNAA